MKQALRQTLVLWVSLLILGGLLFSILQSPPARVWMWNHTGEEDFLPQIKGLSDLAGDLWRPRLRLMPNAVQHTHSSLPFGINVFLEQEAEPVKREQAVQMAAAAGFTWLRQEFPWEDIEIHGKGDFEDRRHEPYRSAWDKYDQIVALAEKYHMQLVVRLSNPPAWTRAKSDEIGEKAPPDNYADFADFVAAVVSRYQGRVRYYQLWNEPNTHREWGDQPLSPENYVELLRLSATAARQADPDVVIIAAAMAATIDLQPDTQPPILNSLNDLIYLQRMYDAGAAPYFDIGAVQGYGLWSGPTDSRMHPRVINFSHHQFVRDLMVQNGDADKPLWISEMNWNAAPDGIEPRYGKVSLETQARYLPIAYERIRTEWPWLGVANTWYLKRATDEWERNGQPEAYFRLLAPDFTPQPVYESFKAYATSLR